MDSSDPRCSMLQYPASSEPDSWRWQIRFSKILKRIVCKARLSKIQILAASCDAWARLCKPPKWNWPQCNILRRYAVCPKDLFQCRVKQCTFPSCKTFAYFAALGLHKTRLDSRFDAAITTSAITREKQWTNSESLQGFLGPCTAPPGLQTVQHTELYCIG